jgi:hypothetical protein
MKQLLSMLVIAGTLAIITLSSCEKEDPYPASSYVSPSYNSPPTSSTANFVLVADNWVNYGGQIYVNTFKDLIKSANPSGNRTVIVYLQENGKQIQISQTEITYMGNQLWANNSLSDVSIFYRCNTQLPFKSLSIRVEVK